MRILLKFVLDCTPDAAWAGIRSPRGMQQASAPFTTFEPLDRIGFPPTWPEGEHPVLLRAFGLVPIGEQIIGISFREREDPATGEMVRVMRDNGRGVSGSLALVSKWQHSIAIAPAGDGRTLYRDQLEFEAGPLTPMLWIGYWAFWQWRAIRIGQLARSWK